MKALVHDYGGYSFSLQLSRGLVQRGWQVLHAYSASTVTPQADLGCQANNPAGLDVTSIVLSRCIRKYNFFERFRLESEYARRLAALCSEFRPDVVLSANTPTIAQHRLWKHCRRNGIGLVTWVQDLYGVAAYLVLKQKLPGLGHAVGQWFMWLDRELLRGSDAVVVITEDFEPRLTSWGVAGSRIHTVHNWAPVEEIVPRPRDNEWSRRQALGPGLRFLYSGTLSVRHNPEILLRLAQRLAPF